MHALLMLIQMFCYRNHFKSAPAEFCVSGTVVYFLSKNLEFSACSSFFRRIIKLQDELVTLRLECTNLYRKGHFISSTDHLQPLNLTAIDLTTDVGSSTLHISSLTGFKKPTTRSELIAISSTQDEGSLRFVYELLAWVEETQVLNTFSIKQKCSLQYTLE